MREQTRSLSNGIQPFAEGSLNWLDSVTVFIGLSINGNVENRCRLILVTVCVRIIKTETGRRQVLQKIPGGILQSNQGNRFGPPR